MPYPLGYIPNARIPPTGEPTDNHMGIPLAVPFVEEETTDLPKQTIDDLLKLLRRVEGQVRGIQQMLLDGRECRDVVTQPSGGHGGAQSRGSVPDLPLFRLVRNMYAYGTHGLPGRRCCPWQSTGRARHRRSAPSSAS